MANPGKKCPRYFPGTFLTFGIFYFQSETFGKIYPTEFNADNRGKNSENPSDPIRKF